MDHPDVELQRQLEHHQMPHKELAVRTCVTEKHISAVLSGEHCISPFFARKLGYVFENAGYWLKLQADYDADQARVCEENKTAADEIAVLKPLRDMMACLIQRGFMHNNCGVPVRSCSFGSF